MWFECTLLVLSLKLLLSVNAVSSLGCGPILTTVAFVYTSICFVLFFPVRAMLIKCLQLAFYEAVDELCLLRMQRMNKILGSVPVKVVDEVEGVTSHEGCFSEFL